MSPRNVGIFAACVLFTISTSYVEAYELEYELRLGVGTSDNIGRTPASEIDDVIALVGVELAYERDSRGLELRIEGDVEHRKYTENSFDSETLGEVNADARVNILSDAISWVVEDRFGHVQSDPFEADSPDNRETINNFTTGPDFRLAMGSSDAVFLSGRYGVSDFHESDVDNDFIQGRLSYVHALSRIRELSFNVAVDEIEYDNPEISGFRRHAAFIGFKSETSRSEVSLRIGRNELKDFITESGGTFVEFEFARDILATSRLVLGYDQRFTNGSELFSDFQNPGAGFGQTRNVTSVGDPLQIKRASAGIEAARGASSYSLFVAGQEDDYETRGEFDRTRFDIRLGGRWSLNETWSVSSSVGMVRNDFDQVDRDDEDLDIRAGLDARLSQRTSVRFEAIHFDRDSNDARFDYIENQLFLTIRVGH